jgi:methylmalonyl-CoA/ethylmalonyl-CoA epimerase
LLKIKSLNHVGIAVLDLDEVVAMFRTKFGLDASDILSYEPAKLRIGLLNTGNCILELMEPMDKKAGTVAKFLEKQGRNSLHHIAFSVVSPLEEVSADLKELDVEMIYPRPQMGAMGHRVNFCHPKFTSDILIELCEEEE